MDNIKLSQDQINQIAFNILANDVIKFINTHRSEYEEFLRREEEKKKKTSH